METRTVRRFAWLPVRLSDGTWGWLVRYLVTERFEPDLTTEWGEVWEVIARHRYGTRAL